MKTSGLLVLYCAFTVENQGKKKIKKTSTFKMLVVSINQSKSQSGVCTYTLQTEERSTAPSAVQLHLAAQLYDHPPPAHHPCASFFRIRAG